MGTKEQIINRLSKLKPQLSQHYHVTVLELFGSIARTEATEQSDVDLLIDFSITPDLLTFLELEAFLENELGRKVDLVPKRKLKSELQEQVFREAIAV